MKRIYISEQCLEGLRAFAEYEGHGNVQAALTTLVKLGIPLYIAQRQHGMPNVSQNSPSYPNVSQNSPSYPNVSQNSPSYPKTGIPCDKVYKEDVATNTLAERLGFKYTKGNSSPLVEEALARREELPPQPKPTFSEVSDESVAALAGFIDEF